MMRWVTLGLPLLLGAYVLTISSTGTLPVVITAAMALALAGAALRRYGLLATGAVLLLLGYLAALLGERRPLEFWAALGFGIGVFLLLEVGYDWITLFRRPVTFAEYEPRWRYLTRTIVATAASAYLVALVGVNLAPRLGAAADSGLFLVGVAGAAIGAVCVGGLLRIWIRRLDQIEYRLDAESPAPPDQDPPGGPR